MHVNMQFYLNMHVGCSQHGPFFLMSTAQTSARRAQPHVFRNPPARANASFMRWRAHECGWPRVSTSLHVLYAVRTDFPPTTSRHAQKKTQKCSLAHSRTSTQHTHTRNRNPCLIRILESTYERAVHKKGGQESKASDW